MPVRAKVRLIVVVGPTSAGKSSLALELARRTNGEVLSADSQQVYRGMNIGTGKVTEAERGGIRHHLIDIADPDDEMTAARFLEAADRVIADASARGVPVVVAGGTMLYVRVLLRGIFAGPPADPTVRAHLEAEAEASEEGSLLLWNRLQGFDAESAERIAPTDRRRVVRALEVFELTGTTMSEHQRKHDFTKIPMRFDAMLVGLSPPRDVLYERINQRVEDMMDAGLLGEVEQLREAGYRRDLRSQQAIGYSELHAHLDGGPDLSHSVRLIQRNSRRYARRQLSWYRRDETISWYEDASAVDLDAAQRYLTAPG